MPFTELNAVEHLTPVGSRMVVQLSEGIEVYLNRGSKLKYPQNFIGATRGVTLSGEGYFKVILNNVEPNDKNKR